MDEVVALQEALRPFYGDDPLLAMYGNDHTEPDPGLLDLIEAAGEQVRIELDDAACLPRASRGDGLPHWRELRSGARANLLMGVTSARIDLKVACARAERGLERYAEPLQALYGERWPGRLLDLAWRRAREPAHDSICGCSADEVSAQVLVRHAEAEEIAAGLATAPSSGSRGELSAARWPSSTPSPRTRTDLIEIEPPIPEEWQAVALELPDGSLVPAQETARDGDTRSLVGMVPAPPLGWTLSAPCPPRSLPRRRTRCRTGCSRSGSHPTGCSSWKAEVAV